LVSFAPGRIEMRMVNKQPREFNTQLAECLEKWTGQKWQIVLSEAEGEPTLAEQEQAAKDKRTAEAATDPLVGAALAAFPGAKILVN
jgi:DNA polymerase-3 subunit gamma/tau